MVLTPAEVLEAPTPRPPNPDQGSKVLKKLMILAPFFGLQVHTLKLKLVDLQVGSCNSLAENQDLSQIYCKFLCNFFQFIRVPRALKQILTKKEASLFPFLPFA